MKPYFRLLLLFFTINAVFSCNTVVNSGEDDEEDDDENEIENITGTEDESDYVFSTDGATQITLNGSSATIAGSGATTEGSKVTITTKGIYVVTGTLTSGQLVVKTDDTDAVKLVLNGMSITNTTTSPLFVDKAVKVILILNDNTNNVFTDGASYSDVDEGQNAAIFSQSYLSVFGNGTLTVTGKYKDGISGKDGVVIKSGNINVTAADDAIRGKDYLHIYDAKITAVSSGDGLLSDNETSASVGIVRIEDGTFNITAGGDGISAASSLTTLNGNFKITSGG